MTTPRSPDAGRLLTREQAAGAFRVHPGSIYRWVRDGKLTPVGEGRDRRYLESEVDALLRARDTGKAEA
jgi:excisionase family DNA binding protein